MSRHSPKEIERIKRIAAKMTPNSLAQGSFAATPGSEARFPTMDEMRKDLEEAGWVQEYANVWKDKRGHYFRGPAKAWHMMMMMPWPPNAAKAK